MNIDELEEVSEDVAEKIDYFMDDFHKFLLHLKHTKYPSSYYALFSFIPKVESIRYAIFELARNGEVYSEKILFRSLCEHFLRLQYIFLRLIKDQNDSVGKEYFLFCGAKENLDFARSLKRRAQILGQQIDLDPLEILKEYQPILENESNRTINRISDQFKHRTVIEYITKTIDKGEGPPAPFLSNIIPLYSELSSFVHGGPSTHRDSEYFSNELLAKETLLNDSKFSLLMSLAVRSFCFLSFAQEEQEFFEPYQIVESGLQKILNEKT